MANVAVAVLLPGVLDILYQPKKFDRRTLTDLKKRFVPSLEQLEHADCFEGLAWTSWLHLLTFSDLFTSSAKIGLRLLP